jgi:hypothetical protein
VTTSKQRNAHRARSLLVEETRFTEGVVGPVSRLVEEVRRSEASAGITQLGRVLDEHRRLVEQLGASPMERMVEEARRSAASAGVAQMRRMVEDQNRLAGLASPIWAAAEKIQRLVDEQNRWAAALNSPAFDAYRRMVTDAVDVISAELEPQPGDDREQLLVRIGSLVGARAQAERLAAWATFMVAFLTFTLPMLGLEVPETVERAVQTLLSFAALMQAYARRR